MDVIKILAVIIVGYLFGSISSAVMLTKDILKKDVRELGSRNAGATNVTRVFGGWFGLITLAGDVLKTVAAMLCGSYLLGSTGMLIAAAACIIGHCIPLFFQFRGGKGVAVAAGIALMLDWRLVILLLLIFSIMYLITKTVSLSSLVASACFPLAQLLLGETRLQFLALGVFIALLICFMHRENIKRLLLHTEPKFSIPKPDNKNKPCQ